MHTVSLMYGTFSRTVTPSAARAAAISARVEFLLPETATLPSRGLPPEILIEST
jgi:hypothetical protein